MRTIEFKSKIRDNRIAIPTRLHSRIAMLPEKSVRVIVLVDDAEIYEEQLYRQAAQAQFLQGYAETDSIYDE